MKKTKKKNQISIQMLLRNYFVHSRDFRENGHPPGLLRYYEKKGILKRVGRGLYLNVQYPPHIDFKWEDLVYTVLSIPNGIITGISALAIYNLTDEIPRFHWIAIPNNTSIGSRPSVTAIRTRNHQLGLSSIKIGDVKVPIYEKERILPEAFKLLSRETAIKALKEAFSSQKKCPNVDKLVDYSRKLRINMIPYLEVVTTT